MSPAPQPQMHCAIGLAEGSTASARQLLAPSLRQAPQEATITQVFEQAPAEDRFVSTDLKLVICLVAVVCHFAADLMGAR